MPTSNGELMALKRSMTNSRPFDKRGRQPLHVWPCAGLLLDTVMDHEQSCPPEVPTLIEDRQTDNDNIMVHIL